MIIAVDGPAASGKGTLARRLADRYGLAYLDTGSLYRAVALAVLRSGDDPHDLNAALKAAKALDPGTIDQAAIRPAEGGDAASIVAAMAPVRDATRDLQRAFAPQAPGAVLDGRDTGTVICPDADVKLFVDANLDVRADRRYRELVADGGRGAPSPEAVRTDLARRDQRDRSRATSPLVPAPDAHLLDTSDLSIEAAFEAACDIIDRIRSNAP